MKTNSKLRGHLIFRVLSLIVLFTPLGDAAAHERPFSRIVTFGTSLSDPGNFYSLEPQSADLFCGMHFEPRSNVPPYTLLTDDPTNFRIPDRPYAKGGLHFTNGPTYVEVLGRQIGLAGSVGPAFRSHSRRATNYAVGGARATDVPCRVNLGYQVNAFKDDFSGSAPSDALYVFEIGSNDVRDALVSTNPPAVITAALAALGQSANELYGMGARNFLFLNVPNLGRLPAVLAADEVSPGASAGADLLAQSYNQGLAALVGEIGGLPGVQFAKVLDVYSDFNDILDHAQDYGFTNTVDTCVTPNDAPFDCRKPGNYVFWDGIHPTRAVHQIFGIEAVKLVAQGNGHGAHVVQGKGHGALVVHRHGEHQSQHH